MRLFFILVIAYCGTLSLSLLSNPSLSASSTNTAFLAAKKKLYVGRSTVRSSTATSSSPSVDATNANSSPLSFSFIPKLGSNSPDNFVANICTISSLSCLVGVLTGIAIHYSKVCISFLENGVRSKYPAITPLIGSVVIGLIHLCRPDILTNAGSIYSASGDSTFSIGRQFLRHIGFLITIGSGLALAFAGPAAEAGITLGRLVGLAFLGQEKERARRILCLAGSAAGFACNFNSPLAGLLYAIEVSDLSGVVAERPINILQHQDQTLENSSPRKQNPPISHSIFTGLPVLLLAVASSMYIGNIIRGDMKISSSFIVPPNPSLSSFSYPSTNFAMPLLQLPSLLILGVICRLISQGFKQLTATLTQQLQKFVKKSWIRPLVAGVFCSISASYFASPLSLAVGYQSLNKIVGGTLTQSLSLIYFFVGKLLSLSVALASGCLGGIVAPSIFAGAPIGVLVQKASTKALSFFMTNSHASMSLLGANPSSYAMIGGAGLLSATFKCPLTATLLVLELTRAYDLAIPLLIVTSFAQTSTL